AMFAFLFAIALPLGFLPLYARSLLDPGVSERLGALLVALPTTAEMAAGLLMALLAGRLIDRRGWVAPAGWCMALAGGRHRSFALAGAAWPFAALLALAGMGNGQVWDCLGGGADDLSPA